MENLNKNIAFVGINCNNAVNSFQQIALTKFVEVDIEELAKLVAKMKELLATTRFKDEHYQASMFLKKLDIQILGGKEHFISFFTYLMLDIFGI